MRTCALVVATIVVAALALNVSAQPGAPAGGQPRGVWANNKGADAHDALINQIDSQVKLTDIQKHKMHGHC